MKRRDLMAALIVALGLTAAWPFAAPAQQVGKPMRIGFLSAYTVEGGKELVGCFRKGLEQSGWVEGRNIVIEYRWSDGKTDRASDQAAELARLNLDLIAVNSTPATQAVKRATGTTPVVFMSVSDPVSSGIVTNLARPEANVTGLSNFFPAVSGKMLEMLKEIVPRASRVGVLFNPGNAGKVLDFKAIEATGKALGVTVDAVGLRTTDSADEVLRSLARALPDALIVLVDQTTLSHREQIVAFAAANRLPAMYQVRDFVDAGGLMSYGLNLCQHFQRAAVHADRILKGTKPAELPVELPTTFELVLNARAAKGLGLAWPPLLLARADEVIE